MIWRRPRPAAMPIDEPNARIIAFLIGQGIPTADAWVEGADVVVDSAIDPAAVLPNYVSSSTREEQAWIMVRNEIKAIRTNPETRTAVQRITDLEQAFIAIAYLAWRES